MAEDRGCITIAMANLDDVAARDFVAALDKGISGGGYGPVVTGWQAMAAHIVSRISTGRLALLIGGLSAMLGGYTLVRLLL